MAARQIPEVSIRRYGSAPDCDVVVKTRGQEMVLRCRNYQQALKWARMECKTYKVSFASLNEAHAYLPTDE
jgi:hypothetical protein